MSYPGTLKDSVNINLFKEEALLRVANDAKATGHGFITILIAGFASVIVDVIVTLISDPARLAGNYFYMLSGALYYFLYLCLTIFIGYSFFHFVAKFIFKGQASGVQYFRALSNTFIIYWLVCIPFAGLVIGLLIWFWLLAVNIFILHKLHKLSLVKAIVVGLLPLMLFAIIMFFGLYMYSSHFLARFM